MAEVENGDLEQEEEAVAVVKRGKVTIVGAGPIGTACGMTLAQKGYFVALLMTNDKAYTVG